MRDLRAQRPARWSTRVVRVLRAAEVNDRKSGHSRLSASKSAAGALQVCRAQEKPRPHSLRAGARSTAQITKVWN